MHKKSAILFSLTAPFVVIAFFTVLGSARIYKTPEEAVPARPKISDKITYKRVDREAVLREFFSKYNSPLLNHSDEFVEVADKYGIDYRLLPAISCIESSCGKRLIPDSYNPFGWGIYGNNVLKFESYNQSINVVGEGISKNYISKGFDTPEKIAPIYNPPSHASWLGKLRFFIKEIDKAQKTDTKISDASSI